ncbi:MAG: hypothetical protein ACLSAP_01460 [Oscillospiraceae bacterium]
MDRPPCGEGDDFSRRSSRGALLSVPMTLVRTTSSGTRIRHLQAPRVNLAPRTAADVAVADIP